MLALLQSNSLTVREIFQPESMGLNLSERDSTATFTLGPDGPELVTGDWVQDLTEPGRGIVWRVRSIDTQYNTETRTITLEHMIASLGDRIIPDEITSENMGGTAAGVSARTAASYVISRQNIWQLGDFEYDDVHPYKFDGETLKTAMETISGSLEDPIWEYSFSSYPFTLHIRQLSSDVGAELRAGRNISTLKYTIDRSRMYTRFYPAGKNDLRLESEYVSKNENLYGRIDRTETDQSKETEAELIAWANDRLLRHAQPSVTVTISGLDLSEASGEILDQLTIGKRCQVPLPDEGALISEKITKLSWRDKIRDPESVTVTLANALEDVQSITRQEQAKSSGGRRAAAKASKDNELLIGDTASGIYSYVIQTSTNILQHVHDELQGYSTIEQTATAIALAVSDASTQNWSLIQQTATGIMSTVHSELEGYSTIEQTATSITAAVTDASTQNWSMIQQSATGIMTTVHSELAGYSTIAQTSTSISLAVNSAETGIYSAINVQKDRISLVVEGSGSSAKIKAAQIVTEINNSGSSVLISADKISIDGTTTINDIMTVNDGSVHISQPLRVTGNVMAESISLRDQSDSATVTAAELYNFIKSASVSGNTLTLTPVRGDPITFSKATSLSGKWSGNQLTILASPQNVSKVVAIAIKGSNASNRPYTVSAVSTNKKLGTASILVQSVGTFAYNASVQNGTVQLDCTQNWNDGYDTGWTAAFGKVTLPKTSQTTNAYIDVKTPNQTAGTADPDNTRYTVSADNDYAYIKYGSVTVARVANPAYGNGLTNGKNAVTIVKGTWSSGAISFTKSEGTASTQSVVLKKGTTSWSGNTATVQILDGTSSTDWSVTVDASDRYTAGRNVGHNEGGATAFVSGSNSISTNGTYTYKGMYVDKDGDDQESGNNLSVTVAVPDWNSGGETANVKRTKNPTVPSGTTPTMLEYGTKYSFTPTYTNVSGSTVTLSSKAMYVQVPADRYNEGWGQAYAQVAYWPQLPSGEDRYYFYVASPAQTVDNYQNKLIMLSTDATPSASGRAYITVHDPGVAQGETFARLPIGNWYTAGYNAGWGQAYAQVAYWPTLPSGQDRYYFYVASPAQTVDNYQNKLIMLSTDSTPSASGYAYVTVHDPGVAQGETFARLPIGNWYTAGYWQCYADFGAAWALAQDTEPTSVSIQAGQRLSVYVQGKPTPDSAYLNRYIVTVEALGGGDNYTLGWNAAREKIVWPTPLSSGDIASSFILKLPSDVNTDVSREIAISTGSIAADAKAAIVVRAPGGTGGNVYARINLGPWYEGGWNKAREKSKWPEQDTSTGVTNKFKVYRTNGNVDADPATRDYYIGSEANLITDSQGRKCVRAYVYYNSTSNRIATLDRPVTISDLGYSSMTITRAPTGATAAGVPTYDAGTLYYLDDNDGKYHAIANSRHWYYSTTALSGTKTVYRS